MRWEGLPDGHFGKRKSESVRFLWNEKHTPSVSPSCDFVKVWSEGRCCRQPFWRMRDVTTQGEVISKYTKEDFPSSQRDYSWRSGIGLDLEHCFGHSSLHRERRCCFFCSLWLLVKSFFNNRGDAADALPMLPGSWCSRRQAESTHLVLHQQSSNGTTGAWTQDPMILSHHLKT